LVETRLAMQIGTSRTPVREALHTLEREGLIESIHRVGYQVKAINWDEVEEISEIRKVNETLAARWAIDRMTPKDLKDLEQNIDYAENEILRGKPQSFVEYDAEFHEILAMASGSQRLLEHCQLLRRHMLLYRIEALYQQEPAMRAIQGHRRILVALKKKDKLAIKEAIHEHIEQSKIDIQRYAFEEKSVNQK
jgi:DNA-binding GntR family transcriptional regulator